MESTKTRRWDWVSAILLFLLPQIPAARLVSTDWTPLLYWTESMAGAGAVLGLALGASSFKNRTAWWLALAYGGVIVPWQLSMYFKDRLLLDRLGNVFSTLGDAFVQFTQRQPVNEPLFFLFWVCLAFWLIAVTAGFALARHHRVFVGILLAGAAIVATQAYGNYQPRGSWLLAVFVFLAVMLAGRVHFLQRRASWAGTTLFVSEDSGSNVFAGLLLTAALATVVAWWIPCLPGSTKRAAEIWNQYVEPVRERLSNAVTSLRGPYGTPGDSFYGGVLSLGQNAAAGDQLVLRVDVLESPGVNLRYYWRGRVYSEYANGAWTAAPSASLLFHADDQDVAIPDRTGRVSGRFRVTSEFPTQRLLYAPGPAVWLDRTADVSAVPAAGTYDVYSWTSRLLMTQGSSYQVRSALRNPTVVELRGAGDLYPDWVIRDHLSVPERHRQRLTLLAEEITVGQESAYDKAAAITNYLRRNIEYSGSVPAAPEGQDPVIWAIFDFKQGYCTYYASAEVLLLRSVGVPARMAVGFSRGEFVDGTYLVHHRDAHAWPEVYFPGIGWVEFEPTANQSPLARPSGLDLAGGVAPQTPDLGEDGEARDEFPEEVELGPAAAPLPFGLTLAGRALYTAVPLVLAGALLFLALRKRAWARIPAYVARRMEASGGAVPGWLRQWERWGHLQPIERLYAPVGWTLRILGHPQPISATPAAQAAALSALLPSAATHAEVLREQLEIGLFTDRGVDLARSRVASLAVVMHGLRARLVATLVALNGGTVYSDADFPYRTRGTR